MTFSSTSHTTRHLRKGSCPRICAQDDHDPSHKHDLVRELFSSFSDGRSYILEKMWDSSHVVTQSRMNEEKCVEKSLYLVMQCESNYSHDI